MRFSRTTITALTVWLLLACAAIAAPKPNIILMMADDMGMGDTSAYQFFTGNGDDVQIHTPSMERLARQGMLFTDAHTPSTRCTATRYGLLTGRYPFRSRLKYFVLFGSQGDPLIEDDRPTLPSMLQSNDYRTAMFGKWHVGLRYTRKDGLPAAGFADVDFTKHIHTGPTDRGFNVAKFTSRSHGTSGPDVGSTKGLNRNTPDQDIGPGHIDGKNILGATKEGRKTTTKGPHAYDLHKLGSRHSDNAIEFLNSHINQSATQKKPFFVYYPANSNHSPYTPDESIGGKPVAGASRTVAGKPMDKRHDYIYENDVALGRLMDWLEANEDPRNPGHKLSENTIVIFTSDNGAEKPTKVATGPFRSNKGSCYEGGHRVPFIISWPKGDIDKGAVSKTPIGLQDLYATFADITGTSLPNYANGEKGAEDSTSIWPALKGKPMPNRTLFVNDHKESKQEPAVLTMRLDDPIVNGKPRKGQWKIFFPSDLIKHGTGKATELYDLSKDLKEQNNLINRKQLKPLISHLTKVAQLHRRRGSSATNLKIGDRISWNWLSDNNGHTTHAKASDGQPASKLRLPSPDKQLTLTLSGTTGSAAFNNDTFHLNPRGLGLSGGKFKQVENGEAILISFDQDVLIESVGLMAGNGVCGGFVKKGDNAPLAIYCMDADNDSKDQFARISDLGILKKGDFLRLDSSPHHGTEPKGQWRLANLTVHTLD